MQPAATEIEREARTVVGCPGPPAEPRTRLYNQALDACGEEPPTRRDSGCAAADDYHFGLALRHTLFRDVENRCW